MIDVRIWVLLYILRYIERLRPISVYTIIDKIYVGIVMRHFSQNCNRVTALDVRFWFLLHILRMNEQNLIKFCIQIVIDKIGIV